MARWYVELSTDTEPLFTVKVVNGKEKAIEEALRIYYTRTVYNKVYPHGKNYGDTIRTIYVTDAFGYAVKEYKIK